MKAQTAPIKRTLAEVEQPREVLDIERAVGYLRDVGSLWAKSPRHVQRAFMREVFSRVVVRGPQVAVISPKPQCAPLFILDWRERFAGDLGVVWLPEQVSEHHNYTPVRNPRTGEALGVPALVLPDIGTTGVIPALR